MEEVFRRMANGCQFPIAYTKSLTIAACSNLAELLRERAVSCAEGGIGYVSGDGACREDSYGQLLNRAIARLSALQQENLQPGDHLILASGDLESFIVTFWACILGGIVPVPLAPPPLSGRSEATVAKLRSVWQTLGRPRMLLRQLPPEDWGIPAAAVLVLTSLPAGEDLPIFACPASGAPAFVQFSSGSTAEPKGVVLSHANVLANLRAIADGLALRPQDRSVNWLPLHHDMGLVGFHLTGLFGGVRQYHLETASFVRRPLLWLELLSRYGATITAAPNFSQALVLSRLNSVERPDWNLASVRLVMNGAEPISVDLMREFLARLKPFGLREEAMFPCYGLAEATLAVCFPPLGEVPRIEHLDRVELQTNGRAVAATDAGPAIRFASEGFPVGGCAVRVVDADDHAVAERVVGHIQIRGANVTSGYYGLSSDLLFTADGWLRTGDLGFLNAGRLCVTGRVKDMLIVNGQNLYAHDVEQAAQQVEGVAAGRVAVCGCQDPACQDLLGQREKLVVFLATPNPERDAARFRAVRRRIQGLIGVRPDAMVPLPASAFAKTTSGKLQRYLLKERFERGEFAAVVAQMEEWMEALPPQGEKVMPRTATEILLQRAWCEALGLPAAEVGVQDRFDDLGGRSIHAALVIARIESHFGVTLHSAELAARPTIADIAALIGRTAGAGTQGKRRYFRG